MKYLRDALDVLVAGKEDVDELEGTLQSLEALIGARPDDLGLDTHCF